MTLDQPPRQNLDPQSQGWRQWVERGILITDSRLEQKYNNDISNSFSATNGTLAKVGSQVQALQIAIEQIQAQQAYLNQLGSKEYRIYATLNFDDASGTLITSGNTDPVRGFTIDRDMYCRITLRANVKCNAAGPGGTGLPISSTVIGRINLDGTLLSIDDALGRVSAAITAPSGGNYGTQTESLLYASAIVPVLAGTHSASAYYQFQGFGATATAVLSNRTMTVDILSAV